MCGKLVTVLSLLALCTAEPPHPDAHARSPHHAVSSQSYTRGDVPLSYKYSAVHIYTTPKPGQYKDHIPHHHYEERNHNEQAHYQYAPVQDTKSHPQELYTKVAPETNEAQVGYHGNGETQVNYHESAGKSQLEPQEPSHYPVHSYVPGQNVHVLPSVARRPEYSAWYRPHKVAVPEKQKDSSDLNKNQIHHKVHHTFLPSTEKTNYYESHAAPEKTVVFATVPKQYKQYPYLYQQAEPAKEAQGNPRPPMVFFNVPKTKTYAYPQKTVFPHYHQDVQQLQFRVNEPKQALPVNYVYVQKPHNYYVSEHQH